MARFWLVLVLAPYALALWLGMPEGLRLDPPPPRPPLPETGAQRVRFEWTYQGQSFEAEWDLLNAWIRAAEQEIERLESETLAELRTRGIGRRHPDIAYWFWRTAWRRVAHLNVDRIDEVVATFRTLRDRRGLDDQQTKALVLNFIQSIRYDTPGGRLGLFAPPQTLLHAFGDCDSKVLLYLLILRKLGYDAVMLYSPHYNHAMVGVRAATTGRSLVLDGFRYYFCETTRPGFRIGQLAGKVGDIRRWRIFRIL